ncbi:MAG: N-6 DNA methylase [Brevinematales bacterium]|nr:N-6 DNA methylase [Brevinematales bacterium]
MHTNPEKAFEEVKVLVDVFKSNSRHYLSNDYQEAEARKDFIDKFFIALGWDVNHDEQKDPYQQEIKIEKTQSNQKRPDYTFFLTPNFKDPVFFIEAKKPAKNLKDKNFYFQTMKYGWNANTPIAILTDFEEFHILDCRYKPNINHVFNGAHKSFRFNEYADKETFNKIYYLFSREAVLDNSIERYAKDLKKPSGKAVQRGLFKENIKPIDDDFLEFIDSMRYTLASAFKKNDTHLNSEELTEAVQRTIDRLVFIRFLEDKLIEQKNYVSEFGEHGNAWREFITVCHNLNIKYNGIVFKKHFIDDQNFSGPELNSFSQICEDISHLNSPYDFDKIPIHILGSIYERFLGKVIHTTDKRVTVEKKPEVIRAGGVYYTPKYIVDYIVKNTVGELIKGKTPLEISKLRIADISCGSGSFLIGAFECLLDYHNAYYRDHPEKALKDGCIEKDGRMVLSIRQKQQILLNNIYGVDIDAQAVEVTQLSLALKMLEDETTATANDMQVLFHEKIIPNLSGNIVCGNSLISTDILSRNLFSGEEERRLNPMDFESAFPGVFKSGGFDCVIGNPPYVKEYTEKDQFKSIKKSHLEKYYQGKMDLWYFFVCYGLDILKSHGYLGFIAPNNWITNAGASILRNKILSDSKIIKYIDFNDFKVFKEASIQTMVFVLQKALLKNIYNIIYNKIIDNKISIKDMQNFMFLNQKLLGISSIEVEINPTFKDSLLNFNEKSKEIILEKIKNNSNYLRCAPVFGQI